MSTAISAAAAEFDELTARHRRELHVHCYRIATNVCLDMIRSR